MAKSSLKSIFSGSFWGVLAKILDAIAKFVTIPMLVGYFGKADYGLIALCFSLNAYLNLMDLGMNIGSIRFFSIWISKAEWEKIVAVSRSSIVFYGVIGVVNAVVFIFMAHYSSHFFNLSPNQIPVFKWMMYILAISSIFNWMSNVITQLLSANGELGWVNGVNVISSCFNFITAFVAIKLELTLPFYFFLYILSTMVTIPMNIYRLKVYKMPIWRLISPKWNGQAFKEILGYSTAIFMMGLFQITANNLRPLLLGKYAAVGVEVLTDYRVIQTITLLVMAFGGVFMQVLLPSASKLYADNNQEKIDKMVYEGTKYICIFLSFIVFLLISNSNLILTIYMGKSYDQLSVWLIIWLLTVLLNMHNIPVASLVLSTGKTKFLVYSSAISCLLSLPITIFLAPRYNVGAAVIGYFVYVSLQISFYYFYYIPRVLKLKSGKIFFKSFMPSAIAGILSWLLVYFVTFEFNSKIITFVMRASVFGLSYFVFCLAIVIRPRELTEIKDKYFNLRDN